MAFCVNLGLLVALCDDIGLLGNLGDVQAVLGALGDVLEDLPVGLLVAPLKPKKRLSSGAQKINLSP